MKCYWILVFGTAALLSLGFPPNIAAQSQPQSQPPSRPQTEPAAKTDGSAPPDGARPRKVWTEDDLIGLRKPSDAQRNPETAGQDQGSKAAVKTDTAAASGAVSARTLSDSSTLPKTFEETATKISTTHKEIAEMESNLEKTKEGYLNSKDDHVKSKLKLDMELAEDDLRERQRDLSVLQGRLEFLKSGKVQPTAQTEPSSIAPQEDHH